MPFIPRAQDPPAKRDKRVLGTRMGPVQLPRSFCLRLNFLRPKGMLAMQITSAFAASLSDRHVH